jgi:hypothetical protein
VSAHAHWEQIGPRADHLDVAAWRLLTEPWTFVIDRSGKISTGFEGGFSVGELQRAVAKVSRG